MACFAGANFSVGRIRLVATDVSNFRVQEPFTTKILPVQMFRSPKAPVCECSHVCRRWTHRFLNSGRWKKPLRSHNSATKLRVIRVYLIGKQLISFPWFTCSGVPISTPTCRRRLTNQFIRMLLAYRHIYLQSTTNGSPAGFVRLQVGGTLTHRPIGVAACVILAISTWVFWPRQSSKRTGKYDPKTGIGRGAPGFRTLLST